MSRFYDGVAHVFISPNVVTRKLLNRTRIDFNASPGTFRKSIDESLVHIKIKLPVLEEFLELDLKTTEEAQAILATSSWEVNP